MYSEQQKLVVAVGELARKRMTGIIDGSIAPSGLSLSFEKLGRGEMLERAFGEPTFDLAELSLSNYVARRDAGQMEFTALPIYVVRSFQHRDIYTRADRGIHQPVDLKGRRVGIAEYHHTAYVWTRGLLHDHYGVAPSDIIWCEGRNTRGEVKAAVAGRHAPVGVRVEAIRSGTLREALLSGEVDALISPRAVPEFEAGHYGIARLFPDKQDECEYFEETQILPVLHIMGIRTVLLEKRPEIALELFRTFEIARRYAADAAPGGWHRADTYGVQERDQNTIAMFLKLHASQGLSSGTLTFDQLFSPIAVSSYRSLSH